MAEIIKSTVIDLDNAESKLNKQLAERINLINAPDHTSTDCWATAAPMIKEATVWIAIAAVLWIATLSAFGN